MVTWLDAYLVYTAKMEGIQGCMHAIWLGMLKYFIANVSRRRSLPPKQLQLRAIRFYIFKV